MSNIMPAFDKFPQEGAVVGRLLAGYGELELELCFCVATARDDFNMVFKAMFRPRGESQRIQIADAMGREPYQALKMGTRFSESRFHRPVGDGTADRASRCPSARRIRRRPGPAAA